MDFEKHLSDSHGVRTSPPLSKAREGAADGTIGGEKERGRALQTSSEKKEEIDGCKERNPNSKKETEELK